jgi:maltooligosyltrehalose synthase
VAVVKAGNGYMAGDISEWIRGALREWLRRDSAKLAEAINRYVDRAATVFGGALQMGYALIFSLPGVPSVYAGGECGEEGKVDHTNRRPYTPRPGSSVETKQRTCVGRGEGVLSRYQVGSEVVVEDRRLVISNTHNNFEFFISNVQKGRYEV